MSSTRVTTQPVAAADALPGRSGALPNVPEVHAVNGNRIQPPFPEGLQTAVFGAGCSWGVEKAGHGETTTEIAPLGDFHHAEGYHQQYLYELPNGYCPVHSTGVSCPVALPGV
ncbi:hypothetical protein GCU56_19680 [Geodermatophilus sabuli]|uniref:peptide-methionine (S)-S-oxide reductase n=1 Tax=Geodermatophilus sabuli TaxID=1564158 RepID=A0A7K3W5P4_9ACTN|nr:peptide-methionine (S)-S-oxide reductase [Geodermatophilus sabuli]NEK60081.1 hypothetical protein [Geodermatophilus sabuli]